MFKNALKLDQRIAVYVPATDNVNQAVNNDAMVKKCAAMLSGFFGGATILNAMRDDAHHTEMENNEDGTVAVTFYYHCLEE